MSPPDPGPPAVRVAPNDTRIEADPQPQPGDGQRTAFMGQALLAGQAPLAASGVRPAPPLGGTTLPRSSSAPGPTRAAAHPGAPREIVIAVAALALLMFVGVAAGSVYLVRTKLLRRSLPSTPPSSQVHSMSPVRPRRGGARGDGGPHGLVIEPVAPVSTSG